MSKSDSNSFLTGALLAILAFFVLWFGFAYVLALSLLFWGHYFNPRWYETAIVWGGSAYLAWLTFRRIVRWFTSRPNRD